jgi:hypothetical protein
MLPSESIAHIWRFSIISDGKTDLEFMPRAVLRLEFESSARCWSVVAFYSLSTAFVFL